MEKNTKGSIQNSKEADETLDKTKTITITARQKKAKRKSPKMKHSNWKEALQKPLREEQSLQNAKRNNKTTKKKSSDRRRPS